MNDIYKHMMKDEILALVLEGITLLDTAGLRKIELEVWAQQMDKEMET